jgi:hypothetical protein
VINLVGLIKTQKNNSDTSSKLDLVVLDRLNQLEEQLYRDLQQPKSIVVLPKPGVSQLTKDTRSVSFSGTTIFDSRSLSKPVIYVSMLICLFHTPTYADKHISVEVLPFTNYSTNTEFTMLRTTRYLDNDYDYIVPICFVIVFVVTFFSALYMCAKQAPPVIINSDASGETIVTKPGDIA